MSVMYRTGSRTQPGVVGGGQIKYYAAIVRERPVVIRKFASEIANMSSLTTTDVYAVLESFMDRLHVHLEEGRIVKLGELGSFSPSLASLGADAPEDVTINSIKKLRVNFRPSKELKKRLSNVDFEKKQDDAPEPAE